MTVTRIIGRQFKAARRAAKRSRRWWPTATQPHTRRLRLQWKLGRAFSAGPYSLCWPAGSLSSAWHGWRSTTRSREPLRYTLVSQPTNSRRSRSRFRGICAPSRYRVSSIFGSLLGRITPKEASSAAIRPGETLGRFVWRASGVHQFYVGTIAMAVALLNFGPIDLQRRIVDVAIADRNVETLIFLGALYFGIILVQAMLKYALLVYQGWVGESAVKLSRDQLAEVASNRTAEDDVSSGQTVNVIGREIDGVGGFVGVSISEFVVNVTFLIVILGYMLYIQPVIALISVVFLVPQVVLALYMQAELNTLVERQVGLVRKLGDETVAQAESNSTDATRRRLPTIGAIFDNRLRFYFLKYGLKTLLNVANAIGPLMVLVVGGWMVIQGQTTIGTVVAFISGLERLSSPLRDLLNFYREFQQAKVQYVMIVKWVEGTS